MEKVTFSWANYTKPTPQNLELLATSLRRIIAAVAGATLVMEANKWIPFTILLIGVMLDELKNFFARASQDYEEVVSINIPPGAEDKVNITNDPEPPKE